MIPLDIEISVTVFVQFYMLYFHVASTSNEVSNKKELKFAKFCIKVKFTLILMYGSYNPPKSIFFISPGHVRIVSTTLRIRCLPVEVYSQL